MSCTLGEVKNRADLIIYWGGNPAECHPRHFTKYTIMQKGKYVPNGRKGRTMVLVDIRETSSAKAADIFLQIRPGKDFHLVNPENDPRYRDYWETYAGLMGRQGVTPDIARAVMRTNTTAIGAIAVQRGDADSLICGTFGQYLWHLGYVRQVLARGALRPVGA